LPRRSGCRRSMEENNPLAAVEHLKQAYAKKNGFIEPPKAVRVYEYRITDCPNALIYFAPGVELDEAERCLKDLYRERFISVKPRGDP
jgi:hypothetical protein